MHVRLALVLALAGCAYRPATALDPDLDAAGDVVLGDAMDGPSDATGTALFDQNATHLVESGASVFCASAALNRDNSWWRVFRPADFGVPVTSPVHTTRVFFASETTVTTTVTIKIATYAGVYDDVALDTGQLTELATDTMAVGGAGAKAWQLPLAADVPAGALIAVEIDATDVDNASGGTLEAFHIGANHDGQTGRSYFGSTTCGVAPGGTATNIVLRVEGTF